MTVWVPGARGMLGRAVVSRLEGWSVPHVATDLELDIADASSVRDHLHVTRPTHIINCAAYTRVDDAEENEAEATRVNGMGPGVLSQEAERIDATIVHPSTDYVFAGDAEEPYREDDPAAPINAYGRGKLAGERAALASGARAFIVRTSWLFGQHGSNFVAAMLRQMAERETLRVVDDQRGRPTYAVDLASACLALAGVGPRAVTASPGVYHFANTGDITWYGFAQEIARAARQRGLPVVTRTIEPVRADQAARPARRPAWSVLDTDKIATALHAEPRPWRDALRAYLDAPEPNDEPA